MGRKRGYSFFAGKQFRHAVNTRYSNYRLQLKNRAMAIARLQKKVKKLEKDLEESRAEQVRLEEDLDECRAEHGPTYDELQSQLDIEKWQTAICQSGIKDLERRLRETDSKAHMNEHLYEMMRDEYDKVSHELCETETKLQKAEFRLNEKGPTKKELELEERCKTVEKSYAKLREALRQHMHDSRENFEELERQMQDFEIFED